MGRIIGGKAGECRAKAASHPSGWHSASHSAGDHSVHPRGVDSGLTVGLSLSRCHWTDRALNSWPVRREALAAVAAIVRLGGVGVNGGGRALGAAASVTANAH